VNSSKKIEDNEIIKPNIINGFDFSLTFSFGIFLEKDIFLSLSLSLLIRFEKALLTTNYLINV
tara:strand:+ start:366 stop:554 length:189 start_codon:yes stop_codon:yes gene_type:complete